MFHFITTQHPRGISCMLKISVVAHLLLVILTNQMPLSMRVHCLVFQMFLNTHAVMLPGVCKLILQEFHVLIYIYSDFVTAPSKLLVDKV